MNDFYKFFNEKMKKEKERNLQIQLELEIEPLPPLKIEENDKKEESGVVVIELF